MSLQIVASHKISPVEGSSVVVGTKDENGIVRKTMQTGYKHHPVGTIIYMLTMVTFFGWFALLAGCTHLYNIAENEEDILMAYKTFCAVFSVGFIWSLSLFWPYSIESLFLRKCLLSEASHVAILDETNNYSTHRMNEFSHQEVARRYIEIYEQMLERPLVEKESGEVIKAIAESLSEGKIPG